MSAARLFAAWLIVVGAMVAGTGVLVYSEGILVHHGGDPSEILYGWDAVRYLCPRIAGGLVALSVVVQVCAWILVGGRR